ncbi:hypothetical protein FACS18948_0090 [Clostridia bacterium]|nr:hypothetical protein FACS18948_0090 [Clostridia bacterium]
MGLINYDINETRPPLSPNARKAVAVLRAVKEKPAPYWVQGDRGYIFLKQMDAVRDIRLQPTEIRDIKSYTFSSALPITYDSLDNNAAAMYFVWRTKAFAGEFDLIADCPDAFIILFATELMHRKNTPKGVLRRLVRLIKLPHEKVTENRLAAWIRDYYVLNSTTDPIKKGRKDKFPELSGGSNAEKTDQFDFPFTYFLQDNGLVDRYPQLFIGSEQEFKQLGRPIDDETIFEVYANISSHKIKDSMFYTGDNIALYKNAFIQLIYEISAEFERLKFPFSNVLIKPRNGHNYKFFQDIAAEDFVKFEHTNRRFSLYLDMQRRDFAQEEFRFRGSYWYCQKMAAIDSFAAKFIGYVMKKLERELRLAIRFKTKLQEPIDIMPSLRGRIREFARAKYYQYQDKEIFSDESLTGGSLAGLIEKAAKRAAAAHTKAALIVESRKKQDAIKVDFSKLDQVRSDAEFVFQKLAVIEDDSEPAEKEVDYSAPLQKNELNESGGGLGFHGIKLALSADYAGVLRCIANDDRAGFVSRAKILGKLPEVVVDEINEFAMDCIGDVIIEPNESGFIVVEEYMDDISSVILENE